MSYDEGTDKYILTSEDSSYYTATWELSLQSAMPGCSLASTGVCTARDVQIAIRQVLGLDPCKSADVDANQICNVVDLQLIINKVVGHY